MSNQSLIEMTETLEIVETGAKKKAMMRFVLASFVAAAVIAGSFATVIASFNAIFS